MSAANTGPSLLVNSRGLPVASLPSGRAATGVFTVPRLQAPSPYDRWGEAPLLMALAIALVLILRRPPVRHQGESASQEDQFR